MDNAEDDDEDTELTFHPEVMKLLAESLAKPLSNKARVSLAKHFPTPSSLRPSRLDTPMRLLVSKQVVSHDRFLQKLQALSTDGAGPLVSLLNRIHGASPSQTGR